MKRDNGSFGIVLGGIDFAALSVTVGTAVVAYGKFIQAIVNFIIIAFVIFLIVRGANRLREHPEKQPTTKECPYCRSVIDIRATRCPDCTSQLEAGKAPA